MKVAYLSVFRDGTGYSNQAVHNMLAMEAGGIDVVARAIKLSPGSNHELAKKVEHLENKSVDNVSVVIQHVLPHQFEYKAGVKNIGMMCWETTHFSRSNWAHCCNLMDELWVPSLQNAQAAKDSGVTVPVKILPCACDIKRFDNPPKSIDSPEFKNKCVFYTIGEMTRRKNIIGLLRAFYSAFSLRDDVVLVIKTNVPGKTSDETINILRKTIQEIKKSLHIYVKHPYYPPVVCMTDFLPDRKLDQLHVTGDVFVSVSHGEACGIPAYDAMGFGNPVILSNWGFYPELTINSAKSVWDPDSKQFRHCLPINCGWLVSGQLTPCFGMVDSFPDLYTGDEFWFDPNIKALIRCMEDAYGRWQENKLDMKSYAAKKRVAEFSYPKVGMIAKDLLTE